MNNSFHVHMEATGVINHQTAELYLALFSCDFCLHLSDSAIEVNADLRPNANFSLRRESTTAKKSYSQIQRKSSANLHVYTLLVWLCWQSVGLISHITQGSSWGLILVTVLSRILASLCHDVNLNAPGIILVKIGADNHPSDDGYLSRTHVNTPKEINGT